MNTTTERGDMHPALKARLQEACDRIAEGVLPTMEERKAAAAQGARMREENAKLFGVQDVTLKAVRQSRDGQGSTSSTLLYISRPMSRNTIRARP
jgi:hypothetical protein